MNVFRERMISGQRMVIESIHENYNVDSQDFKAALLRTLAIHMTGGMCQAVSLGSYVIDKMSGRLHVNEQSAGLYQRMLTICTEIETYCTDKWDDCFPRSPIPLLFPRVHAGRYRVST